MTHRLIMQLGRKIRSWLLGVRDSICGHYFPQNAFMTHPKHTSGWSGGEMGSKRYGNYQVFP